MSSKSKKQKYERGLVLSGGGARGYAHLGVIKALQEADMEPGVISGTSAGAIVGVLYADGFTAEEILEIMSSQSRLEMISLTMPREGLFKIGGISKLLKNNLRSKDFEGLQKPLYVSVTNLNTGQVEYINSGDLINTIIASSSIPVIFAPVKIGDYLYVDGGVIDNAPVEPIRAQCKTIIGSIVNNTGKVDEFGSLISIAERTLQLSIAQGMKHKMDEFDILIRPLEIKSYNTFDQSKAKELFELGYSEAKTALRQK